jgi:flagellar M-ring protein FliF
VNNFFDTLRQLGPARLAAMGAVIIGLLLFFVFVSMRMSNPSMKLVYDNLSTTDAAAMAAKLEEAKIPYSVSADGSKIMASEDNVGRARMMLAGAGLPNGGSMGYEIFDQQSSFGTTNFVQNINQVRALEGELARTISSVDGIRSARVQLVLPERELFSRDSRPASASVFLAVRPGARLQQGQVLAIQSLVASAVPQLKAQSVTVIDNNGNLLARGGEEDDTMLTAKAEEMRRSYEQRTTDTIEDIVGRVVGFGHVRANVTADLNFDKVSTNEEIYDPNGQVVRSTQTTDEKDKEHQAGAGEVSVQNNLPGVPGASGDNPTTESSKAGETTNYEISKTVRSKVSEVGDVKKLSIGILIDGTYDTDKDGKKTYKPRDQATLDQITSLVKSAVGFDEKRGDTVQVVNMQFADIDAGADSGKDTKLFGFERGDLLNAAEIITVAIMVILVVLLVLQPMVGRLLSTDGGLEEGMEADMLTRRAANPALAGPDMQKFESPVAPEEDSLIDMSRVEGKVKASSVKKIEDIVNSYPAETVSVIRSWMGQEN